MTMFKDWFRNQLFEIFTQPNTSVTILAPNHYYMINVNQANSEHILGTLREHSKITQQRLISLVERIQVPGRTIAICLMLQ